jgi:hypothetical protein
MEDERLGGVEIQKQTDDSSVILNAVVRGGEGAPFRLGYRFRSADPDWIGETAEPFRPLLDDMGRRGDLPSASREQAGFGPRETRAPPRGIVALFRGDVDSFYTLLCTVLHKEQPDRRIDRVLSVCLDEHSAEQAGRARRARHAALEAGASVIEASFFKESPGPSFSPAAIWIGAGMALAGGFRVGLVPAAAGTTAQGLSPNVVDPGIAERYATDAFAWLGNGVGIPRTEKLNRLVGRNPVALRTLHVCARNAECNCGLCRDCVHAMLCLEALGMLEKSSAFPPIWDDARLKAFDGRRAEDRLLLKDVRHLFLHTGRRPKLARALARFL